VKFSLKDKMLCIFFVIPFLIVWIDRYTVKVYRSTVSGNGNPGFAPIYILVPLAIWLAINLIKILSNEYFHPFLIALIIPLTVIFDIWGFKSQLIQLSFIRAELLKHNIPPELVVDITNGVTYYTNTVYFNAVTLLIFFLTVTAIGIAIGTIRSILSKKKNMHESI